MPLFYTLLLAASAALVVAAVCRTLRFVYPSLRVMFPAQPETPPYGGMSALLLLLFILALYAPFPLVLAGLIVLAGQARSAVGARSLTPALLAAIAAAIALAGEQAHLAALEPTQPLTVALLALYVALPIAASQQKPRGSLTLLALALIAAGIASAALSGDILHGTPSAILVASVLLAARPFLKAGASSTLRITSALCVSHIGLSIAYGGLGWLALALLGAGLAALLLPVKGRA